MCDMTHSYVRVTWLIRTCVWHDSFLITIYHRVSDLTRSVLYIQRRVLYIQRVRSGVLLFANEPYKKDDILQKRPIILRSILIVATSPGLQTSRAPSSTYSAVSSTYIVEDGAGEVWSPGMKGDVICMSAVYIGDTHTSQCPLHRARQIWSHDAFVCVTWLIGMCDMTHWYVWHDSLVCVTWLI